MSARAGEAGFTLMELMVALTILALAMSVISMGVSRRSPAFETRQAASEVEGMLRGARAAAREENRAVRVSFNVKTRHFSDTSGQSVTLSAQVEADLVTAATAGGSAIIFLPDGSSTGGEITLRSPVREETITVDWLTSRIAREAGA